MPPTLKGSLKGYLTENRLSRPLLMNAFLLSKLTNVVRNGNINNSIPNLNRRIYQMTTQSNAAAEAAVSLPPEAD